jgi:hypothetical protein
MQCNVEFGYRLSIILKNIYIEIVPHRKRNTSPLESLETERERERENTQIHSVGIVPGFSALNQKEYILIFGL